MSYTMTALADNKSMLQHSYNKPAISFESQLQRLKNKGLIIQDDEHALCLLKHVNYYRLKDYAFPHLDRNGVFLPETDLAETISLYEFDRALRLLIFEAIELFEIHFRLAIAYHLGIKYGPFAHEQIQNFASNKETIHAKFICRLGMEASRTKTRLIQNYRMKYTDYPSLPIWIAVEMMSFGTLSMLFGMLQPEDKKAIAKNWDTNFEALASWARSLTMIRNICAHYGRLWNSVEELNIRPRLLNKDKKVGIKNDNIYFIIYLLRRLTNKNPLAGSWAQRTFLFLSRNEGRLSLPEKWKTHPLWIGMAEQ